MTRKKIFKNIIFSLPLLLIVFLLFNGYTVQNRARIAEQNKSYAEDAMRQTAQQISDKFDSGLSIITTYAYFFSTYLEED